MITVFDEKVKHCRGWLSEMILARGDEHVNRGFNFFDEFLTFSFDIIEFRVLLLDTTLVSEDNQSIALIVIFFEFSWNGHVPPDPIGMI